jgi:hypothetical protein
MIKSVNKGMELCYFAYAVESFLKDITLKEIYVEDYF